MLLSDHLFTDLAEFLYDIDLVGEDFMAQFVDLKASLYRLLPVFKAIPSLN